MQEGFENRKPKINNRNFFSFTTVSWLTPLVVKGEKSPLKAEDMYELADSDMTFAISKKIEPFMNKIHTGEKPVLVWTLLEIYAFPMFGMFLASLFDLAATLLSPILIKMLLNRITSGQQEEQLINNGYLIAALVFLMQLVSIFSNSFKSNAVRRLGQLNQSALMSAIYQKCFRLSNKSKLEFSKGRIMNMMNGDIGKVMSFFSKSVDIFFIPVNFILTIVLLYSLIGSAVFYSFIVVAACVIASAVSSSFEAKFYKEYSQAQDERLSIVREMFLGMQMIKYRILETDFYKKNMAARAKQLNGILRMFGCNFSAQILLEGSVDIILVTILTVYSQSHVLTPGIVFPVLGLCGNLTSPLASLLDILNSFSQGYVSIQRISSFLLAEEKAIPQESGEFERGTIKAENITWKWPNAKNDRATNEAFALKDIDIDIKPGMLVAVVGAVGCGKSTLLNGLLSELEQVSGKLNISGNIAYCPQSPWIMSGSIEENIIFGSAYDKSKLKTVIEAAGLTRDLDILVDGIKSKVGEKGISLSGGQKARVSLARALYANSDIYLLDCPLAALDAKVGREVFDNAIKSYLKGNTVIMVTHSLAYLNQMDKIAVMEDGKIVEYGSFDDLMNVQNGKFANLMQDVIFNAPIEAEAEISPQIAVSSVKKEGKAIISTEDQSSGSVKGALYWHLLKMCGFALLPQIVGIVGFFGSTLGLPLWLTYWLGHASDDNQSFYLTVFQVIGYGGLLIMAVPAYYIKVYFSASNIELKRINSVKRSPLMSLYSESLSGMSTLQAFNVEAKWISTQQKLLDDYQGPGYIFNSLSTWMTFRLGMIFSTITFAICLIAGNPNINPDAAAAIGLSLTYASQIARSFKSILSILGMAEQDIISIERLLYYAHEIPQEPEGELSNDPSVKSWPSSGKIEVQHLTMAYDSKPDVNVLHGLTLTIKPGERVGIVGRTGAGKSTFVSSLFRMNFTHSGRILIDNLDIETVGIKTLRGAMYMIPQNPILFQGTIRSNIDAHLEFTDDVLWDALDKCGLKKFVSSLEGGLDYAVESEGSNLSNGQVQLLCTVGAILHKPKIIVFDEATSALDAQSDQEIQTLIDTYCVGATVITIAHRLNTIIKYDKVMVLDQGTLVQFDTPKKLLAEDGLFKELATSAGNFEQLNTLINQ